MTKIPEPATALPWPDGFLDSEDCTGRDQAYAHRCAHAFPALVEALEACEQYISETYNNVMDGDREYSLMILARAALQSIGESDG